MKQPSLTPDDIAAFMDLFKRISFMPPKYLWSYCTLSPEANHDAHVLFEEYRYYVLSKGATHSVMEDRIHRFNKKYGGAVCERIL